MITEQEVDGLIETIWEIEDSEPTELTFRRTDEPLEDDGGPYVVAWMFWCTVLWGIAACAAFVWLGGK